VTETDILFLGKRLFWSDANVDTNDPVQLHLLYGQVLDSHKQTNKQKYNSSLSVISVIDKNFLIDFF
jgi:hypothetical protein